MTPGDERRALGVWYVLFLIGVVLTLGSYSPLGGLLVHVPLFGGERLQNRNAAIFDFPLAVLLGFFLDDLVARGRSWRPLDGLASKLLALVPLLATTVLIAVAYAEPERLERALGIPKVSAKLFDALTPLEATQLVLVAAGLVVVVFARHLSTRTGRALLGLLAVCDIGFYAANESFAQAPISALTGTSALSTAVAHLSSPAGRYALYDPLVVDPSSNREELTEIGISDLNVIEENPSVQGYGSIVASSYEDATDTHTYADLDPARLSGTTFNVLDLTALLTLPQYIERRVAPVGPLPPPRYRLRLEPGARTTFLLAQPTVVRSLDVVLGDASRRRLVVSVVGPRTTARAATLEMSATTAAVRLDRPELATAVTIAEAKGAPAVEATVAVRTASHGGRLLLDGALQGDLPPPHWRFTGTVGNFVAFKNTESGGPAWLQPISTTIANPKLRAPGAVTSTVVVGTDTEQMVVALPAPTLLVRSETYSPGWTARVTPIGGGPTRIVQATRLGLVQAVRLPKGNYSVVWRYAPLSVLAGLVVSGTGVAVLVALVVLALSARRRRHLSEVAAATS